MKDRACRISSVVCVGAILFAMAAVADSRTGLKRFEVTYRVAYSGIELGNFTARAHFENGRYRIDGSGHFTLLEGLLFDWKLSTLASGFLGAAGPQPATFMFEHASGGNRESVTVQYQGAAVASVDNVPPSKPEPAVVPLKQSELVRVLDPLSALFLLGHGESGPSLCNRTIPIFDGRERYDLVLRHKKTVDVRRDGLAQYSGPVVICGVTYIPVSGHVRDDPATIHLAESSEIEVRLVPLPRASLHVPYAIHLPMPGGGFASAVALSLAATPRGTR